MAGQTEEYKAWGDRIQTFSFKESNKTSWEPTRAYDRALAKIGSSGFQLPISITSLWAWHQKWGRKVKVPKSKLRSNFEGCRDGSVFKSAHGATTGNWFRSQHPYNRPGVISNVPVTPMQWRLRVKIRGFVGLLPSWPSRDGLQLQVDLVSKE